MKIHQNIRLLPFVLMPYHHSLFAFVREYGMVNRAPRYRAETAVLLPCVVWAWAELRRLSSDEAAARS